MPEDTSETLYQLSYRGYPMCYHRVSRVHFNTDIYYVKSDGVNQEMSYVAISLSYSRRCLHIVGEPLHTSLFGSRA